jgi:hypothetical protein
MKLRRSFRALPVFLAAVAATAALVAVTPTAGQAAANDWGYLQNGKPQFAYGPLVLAIRGGVRAGAGADALVWTTSTASGGGTVGDQLWRLQPVGVNGEVWIRNAGTSNQYALSVQNNSSSNGTHVIQWWFDATNQYERWQPINLGSDGYRQFRNVGATGSGNGKCLAVAGAGGSSYLEVGAQVVLWDCGSGDDQKWWHS